jgi:hypothetical protein
LLEKFEAKRIEEMSRGAGPHGYPRQTGYYNDMQIYGAQPVVYPVYQVQYAQPMGFCHYSGYQPGYSEAQAPSPVNGTRNHGGYGGQQVPERHERPVAAQAAPSRLLPAVQTREQGKAPASQPVAYPEVDYMPECELPASFHRNVPGTFDIVRRGNLPPMRFHGPGMIDVN